MAKSEKTIVVCGDGLAGLMTSRALEIGLSDAFRIIHISQPEPQQDIVYGSTTAPTAYEFLRELELSEPILFMRTATAFAWGTQYRNWPGTRSEWMQCHQQPFPVLAGVPLQHHLTRNNRPLAPLLISAIAAQQGKFAHPPEERAHPLSRAEYGYQFLATEWARLIRRQLANTRAERLDGAISKVQSEAGAIKSIVLASGETVSADLYIDCTGTERALLSGLDIAFDASRTFHVQTQMHSAQELGPPCRLVEANPSGWRSQTHLQNAVSQMIVTADATSDTSQAYVMGRVQQAWIGNCVAIGASAATQDPLTSAPLTMLQRDIERLLELIPVGEDMGVERREFNRRFDDDATHTGLFSDAFYDCPAVHSTRFWGSARQGTSSEKLRRKRTLFESRGVLAKFDLEPFNDEDWTILHHGLGHRATRYDLQVERASQSEIDKELDAMTRAVEQTVARMPPHHIYVNNMKRYFEKQNYA